METTFTTKDLTVQVSLKTIYDYQKQLLDAKASNLRIQFGFTSTPYTWEDIFGGMSILAIPIDVDSFVDAVLDFYQKNPRP